ncbi:7950_t:CDS:1, partial [Dentiscutata erythropus]
FCGSSHCSEDRLQRQRRVCSSYRSSFCGSSEDRLQRLHFVLVHRALDKIKRLVSIFIDVKISFKATPTILM